MSRITKETIINFIEDVIMVYNSDITDNSLYPTAFFLKYMMILLTIFWMVKSGKIAMTKLENVL